MRDFFGSTLEELAEFCKNLGVPEVHAKTLFRSAYKEFNPTPWLASSLPRSLASQFPQEFSPIPATISQTLASRYDGTQKFLIRLADGALVESVLMPETKRITLCVSSQVGCAQACSFCYTGRMGLKRQMSAGEIVAQVQLARIWIHEHPEWLGEQGYPSYQSVTNVVFMGMGEPLDNIEAVMQSLKILREPFGCHLALRKISVSTAGHLDGLKILLNEFPDVALALSLHAARDRERSQLMPINRRWPIAEVLAYLRSFYAQGLTDRSLLVQYTVIQGVNDSQEHALDLIKLLEGLPVKLNLIPLNEVEPSRFRGPEPRSLEALCKILQTAGMQVMVRYSKGQDIGAACGQLVIKNETKARTADSISEIVN